MRVDSYVEYTNPKEHPILNHFSLYRIVEIKDDKVKVFSQLHGKVFEGFYPITDFTETTTVQVWENAAIWNVDYTGEMLKLKNRRDEQRRQLLLKIGSINGGDNA